MRSQALAQLFVTHPNTVSATGDVPASQDAAQNTLRVPAGFFARELAEQVANARTSFWQ
jgi:hypothetical protein